MVEAESEKEDEEICGFGGEGRGVWLLGSYLFVGGVGSVAILFSFRSRVC